MRETPEWKKFMEDGAFNQTALMGEEYADWVAKEEKRHRDLMKEAGFLAEVTVRRGGAARRPRGARGFPRHSLGSCHERP